MIDSHRRAVVLSVPGQLKIEFLYSSRILKPVVARARPIGGTLTTLDTKEGQIRIVSNFQDVFSKEYGLLQKGLWSNLLI